MKIYLKKLGVVGILRTEFEISKTDFTGILRDNVDEDRFNLFEIFSSSKNEYKGTVTPEGFKLQRRKRFLDFNMNFAKAFGSFSQTDGKLLIETEINAFYGHMIFYFVFLSLAYSVLIVGFFLSANVGGSEAKFAAPFLLFHATLMFGFPILLMRRNVSRMKYELERDFLYMIEMNKRLSTPRNRQD